eukprot:PhM_4_TR9517/c2_g3_i17/m.98317
MRKTFVLSIRGESELRAKGSYQRRTRTTLEMMLPVHVLDEVVEFCARQVTFRQVTFLDSSAVPESDDDDDVDADEEEDRDTLLWEHQTLVVAFVSFEIVLKDRTFPLSPRSACGGSSTCLVKPLTSTHFQASYDDAENNNNNNNNNNSLLSDSTIYTRVASILNDMERIA